MSGFIQDHIGAVEKTDYTRSAIDLINLSADRPRDAFASDIRPIFPATDESFDGEVGQGRIAILAMCLRHIAQTGDGELSSFLGDCLQHVSDCEAYLNRLCQLDTAIFHGHVSEGGSRGFVGGLDESVEVPRVSSGSADSWFRTIVGCHQDSSSKNIHSD